MLLSNSYLGNTYSTLCGCTFERVIIDVSSAVFNNEETDPETIKPLRTTLPLSLSNGECCLVSITRDGSPDLNGGAWKAYTKTPSFISITIFIVTPPYNTGLLLLISPASPPPFLPSLSTTPTISLPLDSFSSPTMKPCFRAPPPQQP
ncbi:hypothetical protein CK203_030762 [Vitis vinifera]|uniref:Uncharacterized protein n=1 Tax=Vitis vinifera TaxID=29760 RepID=A0A438ICZ9_VITVI|nr:hypothetical protein CK203_030762 [Vitis vinifera]